MRYQAVIFDLFGTLINNFTVEFYATSLEQMAGVLDAPVDEFSRLWHTTFDLRCTGILKSPEENIEHVCRELGVPITEQQRDRASRIRYDLTASSLAPVAGATQTLRELKAGGYKTGLVTDCSAETVAAWPNLPFSPFFDVTVFSCLAGVKKPDRRIYLLAAEGLGVNPEDCLYVGDGSSNELSGAAAAGMSPVLIYDPDEASGSMHRVQAEGENWDGPSVTRLTDILELLQ